MKIYAPNAFALSCPMCNWDWANLETWISSPALALYPWLARWVHISVYGDETWHKVGTVMTLTVIFESSPHCVVKDPLIHHCYEPLSPRVIASPLSYSKPFPFFLPLPHSFQNHILLLLYWDMLWLLFTTAFLHLAGLRSCSQCSAEATARAKKGWHHAVAHARS